MNLLSRIIRKKDHVCDACADPINKIAAQFPVRRRNGIATIDMDRVKPESQLDLAREIAQYSGTAQFEGQVRHGFSKAFAGQSDLCPRCGSQTRLYSANFIYATDKGTRVSFAPAGFFCESCPTVIVDEKIVAAGVKPGFLFRKVVGIDYFDTKAEDYFNTWNGHKTSYILDENQQMVDVVADNKMYDTGPRSQGRPRDAVKKAKKKCKLADKSRKRNRKKK
jgi:hypothetical protein